MSANTFCNGCVRDPCEGICKLPSLEYCDDCASKPRRKCEKENNKKRIEHELQRILMNSDEYVNLFLIRLKEELQRRTTSNTSAQTPSK